MTHQHYRRTLAVTATPDQSYAALTSGYGQWWTGTDDAFAAVGDRIKFTFPPNVSFWTFEASKLIPNQLIELECVEAFHRIIDKPNSSETEWLGSRLLFHIELGDEQTLIHFDHEGLTPALDCFEVCEAGWNHFFVSSLKRYLETGVGEPHRMD